MGGKAGSMGGVQAGGYNPGANREYFGNRQNWNPAKTSGQYYGGPSQVGSGVERPGTYGVQSPGAPDPRGNELPRYDGGGQMPPQTGGPLPPYQGGGSVSPGMGNSAVGTPSGPGGNWPFGGNPAGGERPGTYGVNPGNGIRPRWRNGPLLGTPGVFGGR